MEKKEKNTQEYYAIDLLHIVKTLWKRAWAIVLSGLLAAAIGFSIAAFMIVPKYSSSIMLYVNNNSVSLGGASFSISSSQISAAQSLVKTYVELLNNRTTMEKIIEKADVPYTYQQLSGMITAGPSNDTEILKVTVVSENPYEASKIANCIAEVLPVRVSEIIDGASMEVVDSAVPNLGKISPSISGYTAIGLLLGILLSAIVLIILAMLDDTIHDEEYVLRTYHYPILAKVPDLLSASAKQYGYYSQKTQTKRH